jgi:hypothetical protein
MGGACLPAPSLPPCPKGVCVAFGVKSTAFTHRNLLSATKIREKPLNTYAACGVHPYTSATAIWACFHGRQLHHQGRYGAGKKL